MNKNHFIKTGRILFLLGASLFFVGACGPAAKPHATLTTAASTPTLEPAATSTSTSAIQRPAPPVLGEFDPASVSGIKLSDYPIIPEIKPAARLIYQAGLARGNNPHVFSKLGDCMTAGTAVEPPYFLVPFSKGKYDLGKYGSLQAVIDQFAGVPARGNGWKLDSFATIGFAAAGGFNIAGPLDPTWADPKWCEAGESPAACEYRVSQPSLALIMFGTNDVNFTEAEAYDFYLRTLVIQTLDRDILPILSTFPPRPENPEKSLLLNQIVVRVAEAYGIPLINLTQALEPLPNHGVNPENTTQLSIPADERVDVFTEANLQTGFTVRNLVTLQTLEAVLRAVK
jgi:hypothetical protein